MAKLVSMKMSKAEREKQYEPMATGKIDAPVYPYGLSVNLDEDALSKLGIDELPKVDSEMTLTAKVRVTNANSTENTTGGEGGTHKHRSVGLQITDLCLESGKKASDTAGKLYDGNKAAK